MQALIIKAPGAMSNPIAGTPTIPDLTRDVLLEYNAERLTQADGTDVTLWGSAEGSWGTSANLSLASVLRPKFALNGFSNGHPSVKFSREALNYLRTSSSVPLTPVISTPATVVALVKFDASSEGVAATIFSSRDSAPNKYIYCRREISGRLSMGGGVNQELLSPVVSTGVWMVVTCVFDGANSKLFVDKVKTAGVCSASSWDGIVVGANAANTNNLGGEIAALKAYSRALSDAEVLLLRDGWLTSRGLAA
jgi:hypothetical protein